MIKKSMKCGIAGLLLCALAISSFPGMGTIAGAKEKSATEASAKTEKDGPKIAFETTDLDGNKVSSEDIFGDHKITIVNLWGSFCGPCINEMPDLEKLNQKLEDKDCGMIGVVIDAVDGDSKVVKTAKEIVEETGVTYTSVVPWDGFDKDLPAMFVPTTYFIDSNGNIVGEAAVGARGADEYEALLDAALKEAGQA